MSETLTLNDIVLIDGTGAAAVPGTRVVVEDGVIVAVTRSAGHGVGSHVVQGHVLVAARFVGYPHAPRLQRRGAGLGGGVVG